MYVFELPDLLLLITQAFDQNQQSDHMLYILLLIQESWENILILILFRMQLNRQERTQAIIALLAIYDYFSRTFVLKIVADRFNSQTTRVYTFLHVHAELSSTVYTYYDHAAEHQQHRVMRMINCDMQFDSKFGSRTLINGIVFLLLLLNTCIYTLITISSRF